jgi:DNA repair protein NreA
MTINKGAYLKTLTATMNMRSVEVGRELSGSSPPSVFIGAWNYPKVYAGPMIAPVQGDTRIMDMPESWIPSKKTQEEIIGYRLNLVRGKHQVDAGDVSSPFVEKLQEISLSTASIDSEVAFANAPTGRSFSDEHTPFGPSAAIESFDIGSARWDRDLEKVYYDTDLKAADAIVSLHKNGVPSSDIQKAFSVGTMGMGRERRLVPTRWSITACDSIIGDRLLADVKRCNVIDTWRVHEFSSLNNRYAVLLMPGGWQYEWIEAFIHILGKEELIFSDHEGHTKKRDYSSVGGCYYACKMAVLEALSRERRQAGAIVLREASRGYVPLGVFNVRENVRNAMLQPGKEFEDVKAALGYISGRMTLPINRFVENSTLCRDSIRGGQATLSEFMEARG